MTDDTKTVTFGVMLTVTVKAHVRFRGEEVEIVSVQDAHVDRPTPKAIYEQLGDDEWEHLEAKAREAFGKETP